MAFQKMNHRERRAIEKHLRLENKKYSDEFELIVLPESSEPKEDGANRIVVYRNNKFLVQVIDEKGKLRLTVNRTTINTKGDWNDGISWDELQKIKAEVGFGDFDAVEVYPASGDEVNVANMRHLWIMPERLEFAWRKKD